MGGAKDMAYSKRTDGSLPVFPGRGKDDAHSPSPPNLTHTQTNTPLSQLPLLLSLHPFPSPADDDSTDTQEIPLPNVKNSVLAKVIEFCKHHKDDPMNDIEKVRGWAVCAMGGWVGVYVCAHRQDLCVCGCVLVRACSSLCFRLFKLVPATLLLCRDSFTQPPLPPLLTTPSSPPAHLLTPNPTPPAPTPTAPEERQHARGGPGLVRELRERGPGAAVRAHPRRQLHGHQALA